jgi:phage/plasmid-like protein (TIGR03299 family)
MAHMIDMSNDRENMAYIGAKPWHELGSEMDEGASMDKWRIDAGLGFNVNSTPVLYNVDGETMESESNVLYRDDTKAALGIVSDRYKPVQPKQVFDFFNQVSEDHGFKMETAGSLDGGKRIWGLAKVSDGFTLAGNDKVQNYLLLATSYDRTISTRAMFTSVRVVCHNTLSYAYNDTKNFVSIRHNTEFNQGKILMDMGLLNKSWDNFNEKCELLADTQVEVNKAYDFVTKLFSEDGEKLSTRKSNIIQGVFGLYQGNGMGSKMVSTKNTAWGLVNAVTEFVDHQQGNSANNRMRSAWFGQGGDLKQKAFDEALKLVA